MRSAVMVAESRFLPACPPLGLQGRVRRFASACLVVACSGMLFGAAQRTPVSPAGSQADSHADRGLQLAQEGNLEAAESELKQAVDLDPAQESFLASLGTVLAMEKKLDESTAVFDRALKLAPRDTTVRRYLAANLWQLHRYPQARRNLEIILRQTPQDQSALLLFGMVCENMHDYAGAAKALSAVPALVREQPESIAALARSYYHIGKPALARSTLEQLLTHPAGVQGVLLGAHIADEMKDYETAEKLLLSVKPAASDKAKVELEIAAVQYHAKRFLDSQHTLLELIASGQGTGQAYNLLAWCDHVLNQPQDAAQALEQAIKLEPDVEQNYLDLGNILLAHDLLPAALNAAKRAAIAFPDSPKVLLLKGSLEVRMSQFSDAVASYTRAAALDRGSADAILGLAEAQLGAGMSDKARKNFANGMKRFPKDARFPLQFALMLLKQAETGDPAAEPRGEQLLNSALALDHNSSEAHYQLGELALKRGNAAAALAHLEPAAKLAPKNARIHFALARAYRRLGRVDDASKQMSLYEKLKQEEQPAVPSAAGVAHGADSHN